MVSAKITVTCLKKQPCMAVQHGEIGNLDFQKQQSLKNGPCTHIVDQPMGQ